MESLRTLMVQADVRWNAPGENRQRIAELLDGHAGAFDLAVLPETFTTGFLGDAVAKDEGMQGATVAWMRDMAHRHASAVAGSLVIVEEGHRYNRFLFVTADGVLAQYDKRHLFTYGGEDAVYTAGDRRVCFDYRGWRINLQVCYDLRFPVWCRNRDDYDLMLLVANWPARRIHHWSLLLQARAVENQAYVVGVNRCGRDGKGLDYPGQSAVHGPMGETLSRMGPEEAAELIELDLAAVRKARERFPFQPDRDAFHLE
ncbi:MAG: amidohydrolase [Xanthomonadales bacterium]|nr:amidohydrolase [Gammaproteobacteria bacterium]NNL05959.1 amidohydrolase [Xanthomonadales bacterium]